MLKIGSEFVRLWVASGPKHGQIVKIDMSFGRTMLVAKRFIASLIDEYDGHSVSTDGGETWYPQACQFPKLKHHLHSSFEKSLIERTMQCIKDRMESFDDYFPCKKNKRKLKHVKQWFKPSIGKHNAEIAS